MNLGVREALAFHTLFFAVAGIVLWSIPDRAYGASLLALTVGYQLLLPLWALIRGQTDWLSLWAFLLPLSLLQPLPDWALVSIAGTLVFPDHGITRIGGAVPLYFAGMWSMALFPVLLLALATRRPYLTAGALGLVAFTLCEWIARPLELWHAQNAGQIGGVAIYVLVAELLLCWTALAAYRRCRRAGLLTRIGAAAQVSVFYAGALFLSLLLINPLFS